MIEDKMDTALDPVFQDISHRAEYERRQRVYYEMRHNGLRRKVKPFAGAADLHFPLADMIVEKLKPFYYDQLFAGEQLAEFTSLIQQANQWTSQTSGWYDWQVKQRSNLMLELLVAIDHMLMAGNGLLKMRWDNEKARVVYDALDPLTVIVPRSTQLLRDTHRVTLIHSMSVEDYRQAKQYNQDPGFIKRISGVQDFPGQAKFDSKYWREGLTTGATEDDVLLWEIWERDDQNRWSFTTYSPAIPTEPARDKTALAYQHGNLPIYQLPREIKDKGYYSSRGEVEKVAPFEAYLCKLWNEKSDSMTFYNNPIFSVLDSKDAGLLQNTRLSPGKVAQAPIQRVEFGQPPISFDQEMMQTRAIAEQLAAVPDVGLASASGQMGSEKKTAREVQQISQITGLSVTARARVFRLFLAPMLQDHYRLLLQYARNDLTYYYAQKLGAVPEQALHENYLIEVDSNPDSWNKGLQLQKAQNRLQTYRDDPYIDQVELRKSSLEVDDPRLVDRLVIDPQQKQVDEQEQAAAKIPVLMEGFPLSVKPTDNHAVHCEIVFGKMAQLAAVYQGDGRIDAEEQLALNSLQAYLQKQIQAWMQVDPKAAKQWVAQKQQAIQGMAGGGPQQNRGAGL